MMTAADLNMVEEVIKTCSFLTPEPSEERK